MAVWHSVSSFSLHLAQQMSPLRVFVSSFLSSACANVKLSTSARTASIDHAAFIVIPPLVVETARKRPIQLPDVSGLSIILARSIRSGHLERNGRIQSLHFSF